ncbi:MAG: type II toxin-antitoxin system PemK/MazF family toxin [Methylophilaceae bacterium]
MIPQRGDILHLQFDPASGKELKGNHFCLVVSPKPFNERFRLAFVCPISGGAAEIARNTGFLVSLMGYGLRTDGTIHTHQLKSLDWASRKAVFVEKAPEMVVQQVLDCLVTVFEAG